MLKFCGHVQGQFCRAGGASWSISKVYSGAGSKPSAKEEQTFAMLIWQKSFHLLHSCLLLLVILVHGITEYPKSEETTGIIESNSWPGIGPGGCMQAPPGADQTPHSPRKNIPAAGIQIPFIWAGAVPLPGQPSGNVGHAPYKQLWLSQPH